MRYIILTLSLLFLLVLFLYQPNGSADEIIIIFSTLLFLDTLLMMMNYKKTVNHPRLIGVSSAIIWLSVLILIINNIDGQILYVSGVIQVIINIYISFKAWNADPIRR